MKTKMLRIGKAGLLFAGVSLLCGGCGRQERMERAIQITCERAYFEGQKDAISGDIRIRWDEDSKCWRWTKTPWDDGNPSLLDPSGLKD